MLIYAAVLLIIIKVSGTYSILFSGDYLSSLVPVFFSYDKILLVSDTINYVVFFFQENSS